MIREPCRVCGRTNVADNSAKCRQSQYPSGEYYCPSAGPQDTDDDGYFLYQTAEEEAEEAAFWEAVVAAAKERGEI